MSMSKNTILSQIAGCQTLYRPFESLELPQAEREGAFAVKCAEGLFLLLDENGFRLLDRKAGNEYSKDRLPPPDPALDGWHAELAFAPGYVLPCDFKGDTVSLSGESIPVSVGRIRSSFYLLTGDAETLVLVLDVSRFLFYGTVHGERVGGYVKNMPQN